MTLDEAIEQYKSNAEYERTHGNLQGCLEFRQLTDWLKDYKKLKEQETYKDCISLVKNLNIRFVTPNDRDYPLIAMAIVADRDKYNILKIGDSCFVPLFQVIDKIATLPDYIVKNGKKYCPNCGARMSEVKND